MSRQGKWRLAVAVAIAVAASVGAWLLLRFPPDTTPQGAYMRIARAVSDNAPEACFAYLEEEAQHAAFSIAALATKANARIEEAYPEPARAQALLRYRDLAALGDGPGVWARIAAERGFIARLRRDLSGVASVEQLDDRATVVTAGGTRYAFRRRPNGIWGLTLFTAELESEAERMARDWDLIQRDAEDYERAAAKKTQ